LGRGVRVSRKPVSAIMLTLLLMSMLTLAFNIQPVKASGTIYIRADGSIDPPTAPITAVGNVTYVLTDNIHDSVVVERDNIVVNGAGYTVTGSGSGNGTTLTGRSNVTVRNMTIKNFDYGILLYYSSGNNVLSANNVTANNYCGIRLDYSSNNTVSGNNVANNGGGIWLDYSSNNTLFGNNVTANNGGECIFLGYSFNNILSGNNIANNGGGISLGSSSDDNVFYHNNFINNTQHVYIETQSYANSWDDGYPSGGNHWSDYTGVDEKSGPNQDQQGSDGIGDTPYVVDENNLDHYPLKEPWPPTHELVASIMAPISLRVGNSSMLTAIVTNEGAREEASVELRLLINGTATNSTIVPILQPGDSYTLNYLWTPTVEGIYNVTAYAPPGPDEALIENNQQTILVNVSAPEIVVSLMAPASLRVGTSSLLNTTVSNQGLSNETNVELRLLINGTIMNSTTISLLQPGDSYTLSHLWTPTVEGTYNVTAYASPVPSEKSLGNNLVTKFVTVTASLPPGMQVGVKAGDWIKVDYTVTGAPSGTTLPLWLKVEFLSVEGTNATARVTMRMSDGTEQNATLPVDVVAGGQALGLSGFVIPANLTVGDVVYMSGYGNLTIAGETTSSYAGASRTVIYASFSQYGTQLTYYWDKQTGVIVEASTTSGTMTGTGKATETNMWQSAHGFPIDPTLLYIAIAVVIVAAAVFLVLRRRKASTEGTTPETDSHE
jgi:parallel beta-helix repeat protein